MSFSGLTGTLALHETWPYAMFLLVTNIGFKQTARTNHHLCVYLLPPGNPNSTMSQRWILPRMRRMRRICPTQGVSWDCAHLECPWQKDPKRALPTTEEHVDPHIDRRGKKGVDCPCCCSTHQLLRSLAKFQMVFVVLSRAHRSGMLTTCPIITLSEPNTEIAKSTRFVMLRFSNTSR